MQDLWPPPVLGSSMRKRTPNEGRWRFFTGLVDTTLITSRVPLGLARSYTHAMLTHTENIVMDWSDCPEVETVPGKVSGVPILKHSRMPAEGIVENYADGMSAEEIADDFELPVQGVRGLLAYAASRHPMLKP